MFRIACMGTTLACTGHTPQLQQQILGTPDGLSTGARTLRRESCMAAVKFFAGHHPVRRRLTTSLCLTWACALEMATSATVALAALCMANFSLYIVKSLGAYTPTAQVRVQLCMGVETSLGMHAAIASSARSTLHAYMLSTCCLPTTSE